MPPKLAGRALLRRPGGRVEHDAVRTECSAGGSAASARHSGGLPHPAFCSPIDSCVAGGGRLGASVRTRSSVSSCAHGRRARGEATIRCAAIRQLATCRWIEKHQNVVITGMIGTGKTYVACALAQQAPRLAVEEARAEPPSASSVSPAREAPDLEFSPRDPTTYWLLMAVGLPLFHAVLLRVRREGRSGCGPAPWHSELPSCSPWCRFAR